MNDIISFIGTIASIVSIPLGFYFYFKGKEEKRDKLKREIIKILLNQLNDSKLVSVFEIQSVINSKCRESKVDIKSINISEIIDDLISEIISNPLLHKDSKSTYISNLKFLYHLVLTYSDKKIMTKTITIENIQNIDQNILEEELHEAQNTILRKNKTERFSDVFRIVTMIIAAIIGTIGAVTEPYWNRIEIEDIEVYNTFVITLLAGLITAILGLAISLFVKRKKDKKNNRE